MENEKIDNMRYSFSRMISNVFEPPFLAIPVFFILNLSLNQKNFLEIELICLFFATILPILVIFIWSKLKKIDRDYTVKEDRKFPLLIATALYFLGTYILWLFSANPLTIALMLCYGINTIIVFVINLKWKISVHSMGLTGPTTALIFLNPWFFILGLFGPLVMWSRVILKKHTILQVIAGSILGYILTAIQLYYLSTLMYFNVNIDLYLILSIIIALNIAPLALFLINYLNDKNSYEGHTRKIFYFLIFGSFLLFLSFSSFIPNIALVLSGIVSLTIAYFWG